MRLLSGMASNKPPMFLKIVCRVITSCCSKTGGLFQLISAKWLRNAPTSQWPRRVEGDLYETVPMSGVLPGKGNTCAMIVLFYGTSKRRRKPKRMFRVPVRTRVLTPQGSTRVTTPKNLLFFVFFFRIDFAKLQTTL